MNRAVETDNAPAAIGPYSQAVRAGNLVFVSGQIPLDPATGQLVAGPIADQTRQVLNNIKAVLAAADLALDNVVRCDVFLADMNDFADVNKVYAEFFAGRVKPARQAVEVARLPKDVGIEISAIAASG